MSLSKEELRNFIEENNISHNIINTIYKNIHKRHINDIENLSISKRWISILAGLAYIPKIFLNKRLVSEDENTVKYVLELQDGHRIESVLMRIGKKLTLCISSQVGCSLNCSFCATGSMGFKRNLESWEILAQVYTVCSDYKKPINNIVYMGMGEPMLNYDNVISSAHTLNDNDGMNIASQKISISTVGIPSMMKKFIEDDEPFHLILSLHSVLQTKRECIMPIAKRYSIEELLTIVESYYKKRRDWVTIAYIMIKDLNIDTEDSKKLKELLKNLKVKLNLIPYNETKDNDYETPSDEEIEVFKNSLLALNLPVNIRKTQGNDIKGACGQLITESV